VARVLLLHGWTNKRPEGHWIRITAATLRNQGHQVWYPQFPTPDTPNPLEWQDLLRQEANMMDEVDGGEKIVIAHSLGTINWIYGALTNLFNQPFDRALLVAIPDPVMTSETSGIEGEPLNFADPALAQALKKWSGAVTAVASDKDRWQPNGTDFYGSLEIPTVEIQNAGHFSLDDGWGQWPGITSWVETDNPGSLGLR
jgi:predicted alpha/beta hydrolase family esterase